MGSNREKPRMGFFIANPRGGIAALQLPTLLPIPALAVHPVSDLAIRTFAGCDIGM
jgi:hypothetical protein